MTSLYRPLPLVALLACAGKPDSVVPSTTDTADSAAADDTAATDTSPPEDTAPVDSEPVHTGDTATDTALDDTGDPVVEEDPPITFADCFADFVSDPSLPTPDYDAYGPVIGSHCQGTNHQDITGVQRVVFLGDSITVGTPPTSPDDFYRVIMARDLADEFGLEAPDPDWEWYNAFDGTTITRNSGDFWSCAKWGARTDDLIQDNDQVLDCFPVEDWDKTTLVVITMGGNDLFSLVEDDQDGVSESDMWASVYDWTELMREAVAWMKDPGNWGAPVYVVFANTYEFTDGTGDIGACPSSALAGMDGWSIGETVQEMVVWANEDYMKTAVDYSADMIFMMEGFCGHGFNYDDPTNRCYRGAGTDLWFDLTCIHPNPEGHAGLAQMFEDVVHE